MSGTLASLLQQSYSTIPTVNVQFALYTLSIRFPGLSLAPFMTYTFPLSPQALKKESVAMTGIYDVQGPVGNRGVLRIVDKYGTAPPIFTIEGTTGWQRHSNDGFLFTGLQSIQYIEDMLEQYDIMNADLVASGESDLYTLEFYDYFRGDYWQVEPFGEQGIRQNAEKPLYTNYAFRFAGVQAVDVPLFDEVAERLFTQTSALAMRSLQGFLGPVVSGY